MSLLQAHVLAAIGAAIASSSTLVAIGIRYLGQAAPAYIEKEGVSLLNAELGKLKNPEDKVLFKAILAWVKCKVADAGTAWAAVAADKLCAKIPALKPSRDEIIAMLTGMETSAQDVLDKESK